MFKVIRNQIYEKKLEMQEVKSCHTFSFGGMEKSNLIIKLKLKSIVALVFGFFW